MSDYIPIPVEAARDIATQYQKCVVIICAYDAVFGNLHTTTFGVTPENKSWAAKGGEIAAKAPGKMWKRHDGSFDQAFLAAGGKPVWLLAWYGECSQARCPKPCPDHCSNHRREIIIA